MTTECQEMFVLLCKTLKKRVAVKWYDVGGWELDYDPSRGGYAIREILTVKGGRKNLTPRLSEAQFTLFLHSFLGLLESVQDDFLYKYNGG